MTPNQPLNASVNLCALVQNTSVCHKLYPNYIFDNWHVLKAIISMALAANGSLDQSVRFPATWHVFTGLPPSSYFVHTYVH